MDELLKGMTEKLTADQCKKLSVSLRIIQDQKMAEEKVGFDWRFFKIQNLLRLWPSYV